MHDRYVAALTQRLGELVVDDALKTGTHIGPVVDGRQLEQNLSYIDIGRKEGATLVTGGQALTAAGVDYHVPFGGRKGSSFGPREQGRYAAEFYTVVKTAYTRA